MGNDGGSIANPIDLLNLYKEHGTQKQLPGDSMVDNSQDRLIRCRLTGKSLENEIVVSDYKGNLFIKVEILQALLDKGNNAMSQFPYIRTLNDLVTVNVNFNKETHQIICPITKSTQSFSYIRRCGCVLNKGLIDHLLELRVQVCPNCNEDFDELDIVVLNPFQDEAISNKNQNTVDNLYQRGLYHNKKPRKKKAKNGCESKGSVSKGPELKKPESKGPESSSTKRSNPSSGPLNTLKKSRKDSH